MDASDRLLAGLLVLGLPMAGCTLVTDFDRPGRDTGPDALLDADETNDGGAMDAGPVDASMLDAPSTLDAPMLDAPSTLDAPLTLDAPFTLDAPTLDAPTLEDGGIDGGLEVDAWSPDAPAMPDAFTPDAFEPDGFVPVDAGPPRDAWAPCLADAECGGSVCFDGQCLPLTHPASACRAVSAGHDYVWRCGWTGDATYEDIVRTDGPTSYWLLDETVTSMGATLADSSGARSLTVRSFASGGALTGGQPGLVHGGHAARFDRAYGEADHASAGTLGTAMTLELWARAEEPPASTAFAGGCPFSYRELVGGNKVGVALIYAGAGRTPDPNYWEELLGLGTSSWLITHTPSMAAPHTAHVVMSYDGTEASITVDGTMATTIRAQPLLTPSSAPLFLGVANDTPPTTPNYPFAGTLDEVALYARALTPSEIAEHLRYGRIAQRVILPAQVSQSSIDGSGAPHPPTNAVDGSFAFGDADVARTNSGPGESFVVTLPAVQVQYVYVRFGAGGTHRIGYRTGAATWRVLDVSASAGETILAAIASDGGPALLDALRIERPDGAAVSVAEVQLWGLP